MVNRFNRDFGNFFSEERESAAHWGREPPADIFQTRDYVNKKIPEPRRLRDFQSLYLNLLLSKSKNVGE